MISRSQKIRLGVFVIVSLIALLLTLVLTIAPKFFEKRDTYFIGYRNISVTGLQEGGPVKYHGLTVGYVKDIRIDPQDIRRVIVEISLDHGTPIKDDTQADITAMGITGLMLIELRSGSNDSPPLEIGGYIPPGRSFSELITGRAEIIAEKAEIMLNNINTLTHQDKQEKILTMMNHFSQAMQSMHLLLSSNNQALSRTLAKTDTLTSEFLQLAKNANQTMNTVNHVLLSDSLVTIVGNLAEMTNAVNGQELAGLVSELNLALRRMNRVLRTVDSGLNQNQSDIINSINAMNESIEYLNEFSRMISEDPSVLLRGTKTANVPDFDLEN